MMLAPIVGAAPLKLYSACFGPNKIKKTVSLRTAFKSENSGFGQIEALLYKNNGINYVVGYKNLKRPLGIPAFESDFFRKDTKYLWQLKRESPINKGLVFLNPEPGYWILSPEEDMQLEAYKKLLEETTWTKEEPSQNKGVVDFCVGEDGKGTDRNGLAYVDNLVIQAIENYIFDLLDKTHMGIKYDAEGCSIDNDINHLRLNLKNYRENPDQASKDELFIKAGTLSRFSSNGKNVLRPTSELLRTAIVSEIQKLEKKRRKAVFLKQESKEHWFRQSSEMLKKLHNELWTGFPLPSPT